MQQLFRDELDHLDLTGEVKIEKHVYGGDSFGDVWRGRRDATEVTIMIPKVYQRHDDRPLELVAKASVNIRL